MKLYALVLFISMAVTSALNLGSEVRDGSWSVGVPSYDVFETANFDYLQESPEQLFHTHLKPVFLLRNYSWEGEELEFVERLRKIYGPDRFFEDGGEVLDVREGLDRNELEELSDWVQRFAFESVGKCPGGGPNDASSECTFVVGWNRERDDFPWIFSAFWLADDKILIVDDSVLNAE